MERAGGRSRSSAPDRAGLAAAIPLTHYEFRVAVVYDERANVGLRFHGEIENWSTEVDVTALLARMGIKTNFFCRLHAGRSLRS